MTKLVKRKIYILIPTHNRIEILCSTLLSVIKQLSNNEAILIVVDAGSIDGTRKVLQEQFQSVEIIQGHSNMWWTASVNHGLRHIAKTACTEDRVLLMNDDIELAPEALPRLLDASELKPRALIGAVNIVQRPKEKPLVYFCGGKYDLRFARHKSNLAEGTLWQESTRRFFESDFLYGRLLIIPWEVFQLGGNFDEKNFPQYCADEDFSYGAKCLGFEILVDSFSKVFVNEETTARYSLCITKSGWKGVLNALTAFNSCYNLKQSWVFSKRYAKIPIIFFICRYVIIFWNENFTIKKQ